MGAKASAKTAETDPQDQPFDLAGVVNDEDPTSTLGEQDLGDEVADDDLPEGEPAEEAPAEDEAPAEEEEAPADEEAPEEEEPAEGEPAEEEPAEEEAPAEEAPPRDDKGRFAKEPSIPKSRFDQRTAQLRAAERELAEAQKKIQESETARQKAEREANTMSDEQLQAKMSEANAALIDGDTEKAAALQSEVFKAMRAGQESRDAPAAPVDSAKIAADVRDQILFEQTLTDISTRYPALDENHASFDETLSQEAVDFQQMYYQRGYTRAEATSKAAEAVAKIHGLTDTAAAAAPAEKPSAKAAMAKASQAASKKGKVAAAKKAPPALGGSSGANADSADSVDVDALTVEDWAALPDSVRSRLLGD